jgi:hypothetical protein
LIYEGVFKMCKSIKNNGFIKNGSRFFFYVLPLLLFFSCTTSSRVFYNRSGAGEVRKDIGRIEGFQQTIEEATNRIELYGRNIEGCIESEERLIEELGNILRFIRNRGDGNAKKAVRKD